MPKWISGLYAQYYLDTGELDKAEPYMSEFKAYSQANPKYDGGTYNTMNGMLFQRKHEYTKAMETDKSSKCCSL